MQLNVRESHRSQSLDCICKIGKGLKSQLVKLPLSGLDVFVAERQMDVLDGGLDDWKKGKWNISDKGDFQIW